MEHKEETTSVGRVTGPYSNETLICQVKKMINPLRGLFHGDNPLDYLLPVFLAQISMIAFTSQLVHLILRPLRQSMLSSQILAGILLGPSFLGHYFPSMTKIFPLGNSVTLRIASYFGCMIHLFLITLQMDTSIIWSTGKSSILIGITGSVLPPVVGSLIYMVVLRTTTIDASVMTSVPSILIIHSLSSFPVITSVLSDLKILNSELGRFATKTSMISDLFSILMTEIGSKFLQQTYQIAFESIVCVAGFAIILIYVIRPFILWLTKYTKHGEPLAEGHFFVILAMVMMSAFFSEVIGQHFAFGPVLLGMALPDGPPLGLELEQKFNTFCNGLLLPVFCAIGGFHANMVNMQFGKSESIIELVIIVTYIAKFMGTVVPAICCGVQLKDAFCLALIMCCKGIMEVAVYCSMKDAQRLDLKAFNLLMISMLVLTGTMRPLVSYLYDPSKRYMSGYRRTLQSNCNNHLRIVVCIHNVDNVPPILNLLKACNPTRYTPIDVFVLHLMKLTGRSAAILAPHHQLDNLNVRGYRSTNSVNAFNQFEQKNLGSVKLQHFTVVAPYKSMHGDVCTIALDKRTDIVIVPFHKNWSFNGRVGFINPPLRYVNYNVMEKAPCSVALLVDRGQPDNNLSVLNTHSFYRIGVLYFNGYDDWEALALGKRMADHPQIRLLIVIFKSYCHDNEKERNFEHFFKNFTTSENMHKIQYEEFIVENGEGTTRVIRSLEDSLDLVILGRHQDPTSSFTSGLTEWKECPELGLVGDMLSSSDFRFSVLVVVQEPLKSGIMDKGTMSLDSNGSLDSRPSSKFSSSDNIEESNMW